MMKKSNIFFVALSTAALMCSTGFAEKTDGKMLETKAVKEAKEVASKETKAKVAKPHVVRAHKKHRHSAVKSSDSKVVVVAQEKTKEPEATPPSLKISGFSMVNLWGVNQKNRTNGKGMSYHLASDLSDLYFVVAGRSTGGLGYKYQMTFEAVPGDKLNVAQNFIELSYGATLQLGAAPGFERSGLQDASRLLGGMGGFSAPLDRVFNYASGAMTSYRMVGETKYAVKATVLTPSFYGLRLALGYTPNTAQLGDGGLNTSHAAGIKSPGNNNGVYPKSDKVPFGVHNIVVGLGYNREAGDWNFKANATGIFDRSYIVNSSATTYTRTKVRNTKAYQLGAILGYKQFQVGGGWMDNGKSRLPTGSLVVDSINLGDTYQGDAGKAWNVGANYTFGIYQLAFAHQRTVRKTNLINRVSNDTTTATFDVSPLTGLKLFVEGNYIRSRTNDSQTAIYQAANDKYAAAKTYAIGNNSGLVGLTGVKVSF